jgi:hypothetical protein
MFYEDAASLVDVACNRCLGIVELRFEACVGGMRRNLSRWVNER